MDIFTLGDAQVELKRIVKLATDNDYAAIDTLNALKDKAKYIQDVNTRAEQFLTFIINSALMIKAKYSDDKDNMLNKIRVFTLLASDLFEFARKSQAEQVNMSFNDIVKIKETYNIFCDATSTFIGGHTTKYDFGAVLIYIAQDMNLQKFLELN
jgi:hypothetical protein